VEEVKDKGTEHILNKIRAENFPNWERWSSRYRRLLAHQTDKTRKEHLHITL
jgi:hypothetical protein